MSEKRKKEEREKLKEAKACEKEKKKQEKKAQKEIKKKPRRQKRKRTPLLSSDSEVESESGTGPSRKQAKRRSCLPAGFRTSEDSSDSSGNESDTVCGKCNKRELNECSDKHVFWIDCDVCDKWFHVLCVFGKNYTKSSYVCEDCT